MKICGFRVHAHVVVDASVIAQDQGLGEQVGEDHLQTNHLVAGEIHRLGWARYIREHLRSERERENKGEGAGGGGRGVGVVGGGGGGQETDHNKTVVAMTSTVCMKVARLA